jgi:tRNA/rRNA methyltransferase
MSCKNDVCQLKPLDHIHVVLVEPSNSLNIGSVARAMLNLGAKKLHLVAPVDFKEQKAKATACWATEIIEGAQFHDTLEEALAPMEEVVGFTSRHGKYRPGQAFLPDWIEEVKAAPPVETALVFGCERTGLRMEHIELCRWLIRIPSTEENPVYNLAQSVLLTLYELSKISWDKFEPAQTPELPTWNEFYQLDRIVTSVLLRSKFYRKGSPEPIPALIRNLIRRMSPDAREMRVLLGMFARIDKTLEVHGVEYAEDFVGVEELLEGLDEAS